MTTELELYATDGCHLCDEAWAIAAPEVERRGHRLFVVDILDLDAAQTRYERRIPVLRRPDTGAELDWPFTVDDLRGFLA